MKRNTLKKILIGFLAVIVVLMGIVLFIAEKTVAGISLIITGVIIVLPIEKHKFLKWVRVVLILLLFAVAVVNISGTDIPPDRETTGFKFADQIIMIFQNFTEKLNK